MSVKPLPEAKVLHSLFDYDPSTGFVTRKVSVRGRNGAKGTVVGHSQGIGKHLCVCIDGEGYYLHRIIWKMVTGYDPLTQIVDHINGNTKDNSWGNLRLTDKSGNNRNSVSKTFMYGYRGVSKLGNKYRAYVKVEGKYKHLGMFNSVHEAVSAVKQAEQKIALTVGDTVMLERASR